VRLAGYLCAHREKDPDEMLVAQEAAVGAYPEGVAHEGLEEVLSGGQPPA